MRKKEYRLILLRSFKFSSGNYFCSFKCKEDENNLEVDLRHDSGEMSFTLVDKDTNEEKAVSNPETGIINFPLVNGHKYSFVVHTSKACGGYKIRIKKIL